MRGETCQGVHSCPVLLSPIRGSHTHLGHETRFRLLWVCSVVIMIYSLSLVYFGEDLVFVVNYSLLLHVIFPINPRGFKSPVQSPSSHTHTMCV